MQGRDDTHLPTAQPADAVGPERRRALRAQVPRPCRAVALADHVHSVQQQQARLRAAPLGDGRVRCRLRYPAC